MACERIQRQILDGGWDEASLRRASAALEHVERCPHCREALLSYDELRGALRLEERVEPTGGWAQWE